MQGMHGALHRVYMHIHTHTYISLGHPVHANTERFHIFSDFSQLLA